MKFKSIVKSAAMILAVGGVALVMTAEGAYAQQANDPPGQARKNDPTIGNGNGNKQNSPPGQIGNDNSKRGQHCNGNGRDCGPAPIIDPVIPVVEDVTESGDGVMVIDCALPEYKNDPVCVVPPKKKGKRKLLSVKLSNDEQIAPPVATVVEAAPAPVATPAPVVAAEPAPAPVAKAKPVVIEQPKDLMSNTFQ